MHNAINETLKHLKKEADMFQAIANELLASRERITHIVDTFKADTNQSTTAPSASYADTFTPEEKKPRKNLGITKEVSKFIDKYFKNNDDFTMETFTKRVKGLIPEADPKTIQNTFYKQLKKKGYITTHSEENGVMVYNITENMKLQKP